MFPCVPPRSPQPAMGRRQSYVDFSSSKNTGVSRRTFTPATVPSIHNQDSSDKKSSHCPYVAHVICSNLASISVSRRSALGNRNTADEGIL